MLLRISLSPPTHTHTRNGEGEGSQGGQGPQRAQAAVGRVHALLQGEHTGPAWRQPDARCSLCVPDTRTRPPARAGTQDMRKVVQEENPGVSFGEVGKLLGAKWQEADEKTKKVGAQPPARVPGDAGVPAAPAPRCLSPSVGACEGLPWGTNRAVTARLAPAFACLHPVPLRQAVWHAGRRVVGGGGGADRRPGDACCANCPGPRLGRPVPVSRRHPLPLHLHRSTLSWRRSTRSATSATWPRACPRQRGPYWVGWPSGVYCAVRPLTHTCCAASTAHRYKK